MTECDLCSRPARPDCVLCGACSERASRHSKKRYLALKAAGTCTRCATAPAQQGAVRCGACSAALNAARRARKPERHCRGCSEIVGPYRRWCAECLADQIVSKRLCAIEVGLCTRCLRRPAREGRQTCAQCGHAHSLASMRAEKKKRRRDE